MPDREYPPRRLRHLAWPAVLAVSLALHWLAIAWIGEALPVPGGDRESSAVPVSVALLPPPEVRTALPGPAAQRARPPVRQVAPAPRAAADAAAPSATAQPPDPLAEAASVPTARPDAGGTSADAAPPAGPGPYGSPPDAEPAEPPRGEPLPAPPSGHWRFLVHYGDYSEGRQLASIDYRIALDGARYELRSEGRAEGLTALLYSGVLSQSSSGRLTPEGLAPERYAEQRGRKPERWAQRDPASGRATFSGGETADAPAGVQDRLSVLVQLGLVARARPQGFAPGAVVEIPELTLRDVERARYRIHGDETLQTATGPIRALRIERIAPRREGDPRIEVWLGYDRGMLPVRIRLTDVGGRVLDQLSPP